MNNSPHTVSAQQVLYTGCRWNESPEAKPDLDWATLILAILALNTANRYKVFGMRTSVQMMRLAHTACSIGTGKETELAGSNVLDIEDFIDDGDKAQEVDVSVHSKSRSHSTKRRD